MSVSYNELDPTIVTRAAERVLSLGTDTLQQELEDSLKLVAPKRSRRLEQSIKVHRLNDLEYYFEAIEYAEHVIRGSRRHRVTPEQARALHWEEGGRDFFSMGHWIPAIAPNNFAERALDLERARAEGYYQEAASAVQRQIR